MMMNQLSRSRWILLSMLLGLMVVTTVRAQEPVKPQWAYSPNLLQPFWKGDTVYGETILFIRDAAGVARASVLFPISEVLTAQNSAGNITYKHGEDFLWEPGSREIILPAGSRIPSRSLAELRRPAKTQKYELTHRDGNGEIFFGGRLEYAEMQTCLTYRHVSDAWKGPQPRYQAEVLPRSTKRLLDRQPLTIVVLGDSISAGANASGLYDSPPFQPPYPELVRRQLAERFQSEVILKNLSVGGKDTAWGVSQVEKVIAEKPDLVVLAFGMNDSAGRTPKSFQENTQAMIAGIREQQPDCEFILVASMLGNRDWVRLKSEYFPQYRDALQELVAPHIALADLTSIWSTFLELKKDWDLSGNGVNHPNDFGHRVYAQVITTLLDPRN